MTENTELTVAEVLSGQDEVLALQLTELRGIHERLKSISTWVVFGGVVLLLYLILGACNVLFVGP